jgi:MFS transporter, putative metabolite:H+ symporter
VPALKKTPLTPYQWRLFAFLSVATFFEGYDFIALTQILPNLRADMGLDKTDAGRLVALINFGTVVAYLLIRRADQWGRRRVLTITIAGYTVFTFLTGLAPNAWVFAALQLLARIFLIGEWAISMVIAAEEFPDDRRGTVIGVINAFSTLGAITCAGLVPILLETPWGWRSVYFVGILPLITIAYARRGLRETQRFEERRPGPQGSLLDIWRSPYRKRVVQLGIIWFVAYIATQNAVTFWKDFAVTERGLTDAEVGSSVVLAAILAMPLVFLSGRLLDWIGRRWGAAIIFALTALGTFGIYTLHGLWPLRAMLILGIFGASAYLPVLNAFTTELFPTERRADGFAWANNLIGRAGYFLSPLVLGAFAEPYGWGPVIRTTAIFPLVVIGLIFWWLPETRSRTLEETSTV